jgi:molybdopterin synthase sulfur carrier subunit
MSVKILYFASLREAVGCASETVDLPPAVATVAALRNHLAARGAAWAALDTHRNLRSAVNHKVAGPDAPVAAGDEVAFFPPVTGG